MTSPRALAFRFDVDSVRCIRVGIPRLEALAARRGVRFTFFVNMGRSFNWGVEFRRRFGRASGTPARSVPALSTVTKLGLPGIVETLALNPRLGDRFRATFDRLHGAGHELGLHGGEDHAMWQRELADLELHELRDLLQSAWDRFTARYGVPAGFASPGFVYDDRVLDLIEEFGFAYASDMGGELPFHAAWPSAPAEPHVQVPVNVLGAERVPLVEQMLAQGASPDAIAERAASEIRSRDYALMYGHPYVEGVHAEILDDILERVETTHEVVTMAEYVRRWQARHG